MTGLRLAHQRAPASTAGRPPLNDSDYRFLPLSLTHPTVVMFIVIIFYTLRAAGQQWKKWMWVIYMFFCISSLWFSSIHLVSSDSSINCPSFRLNSESWKDFVGNIFEFYSSGFLPQNDSCLVTYIWYFVNQSTFSRCFHHLNVSHDLFELHIIFVY